MLGRRKKDTPAEKAAPPYGKGNGAGNGDLKSPCKRLGDILVEEGAITEEQLQEALAFKQEHSYFLGRALVELNYMDQDTLVSFLVKQCKIPHLSLLDYNIDPELLEYIPQETCEKYNLLPIDKLGKILTVAMVDPLDIEALEVVRAACPNLRVKPILCNWQHYDQVTAKLFGTKEASGEGGGEDVSASSFGLAALPEEQTPPDKAPEKADKALDEALSGAVDDLLEESKKAQPSAPRPEPAPAPPAPAAPVQAAPSADIVAALNETLGSFGEQLRETMTSVAAPAAGPTADELAAALGASVNSAMKEALAGFTPPVAPAEGASSESMQELIEALRETVTGLAKDGAQKAAPSAVPEELAEALKESVGSALREGLADVVTEIGSRAPQGAGAGPSLDTEALAAAVHDSVGAAMQESLTSFTAGLQDLVGSASAPQTGPTAQELAGAVSDSVGAAMQKSMAGLTKHLEGLAAEPAKEEAAMPTASELAEAVRDSVGAVMQETMAGFSKQVQSLIEAQPEHDGADTARELAEAVRTSIEESMATAAATLATGAQDAKAEAEAVAEAFQADLEKRLPFKRKKGHASVMPFGADKKGALLALDNMEPDERVLSGLDSAHPLAGFTFKSFFPGKTNQFTFEVSQAVAAKPASEYNPFFLYGDVGLGKTHLINAIGNEITSKRTDLRVGYVSSSHFSKCLKDALSEEALDAFRENYCHWDILILDDIQFMGGKVDAQEEFFHIFNILLEEGRQIIIAGDKSPDKLGMLERRLVSRFASGIVADLKPPDRLTRMEILKHQAKAMKAKIAEDVLMLVAMQVPGDVRKMNGALRKIVAFGDLVGQDISCEMADEILSHLVPDTSTV